MDSRACAVLHVSHAFTGCDTTSALAGRGKKTAFNTWKLFLRSQQHLKTYYTCKKILEMQLHFNFAAFCSFNAYDRTSDIAELMRPENISLHESQEA